MLDSNEELNTDKVRDHCHITGRTRWIKGYDGHIIFKELNNFDVTIYVIPKTIETYMSIIVNSILLLTEINFISVH